LFLSQHPQERRPFGLVGFDGEQLAKVINVELCGYAVHIQYGPSRSVDYTTYPRGISINEGNLLEILVPTAQAKKHGLAGTHSLSH
jgi:hypothetical protein